MKISPDPQNTIENLLYENNIKSKGIYITVLVAVIAVIVLLPFIRISLTVQGRGFIRPVSEKTEIRTNLTEMVHMVYIREGQLVKAGDTILTLRKEHLMSRGELLENELKKTCRYIADLHILCVVADADMKSLGSEIYAQQLALYNRRVSELDTRIEKAAKEVERNRVLFQKDIISAKAFDDLKFELDRTKKEKRILTSNQLALWKADLAEYSSKQESLKHEVQQWQKEKDSYTMVAPVAGTIEEFRGIFPGTMLQAGQTVAILSPASEIIAEVYMAAKDIGCLKKQQQVRIQVDAFNYNEWGYVTGYVDEISDDFMLINDVPVFKVKCRLDRQYLQLKNGIKGSLKKGMTVNACFMMTERTLFQLLYQRSDDWFNPSRSLVAHAD